jgi:hypothetical protein
MRGRPIKTLPLFLIMSIALWAADPVLGTWKLNLGKSSYSPGPAPKSQIRIYEADAQGVKVTVRTVDAAGAPSTNVVLENYDMKTYPIHGNGQFSEVAPEKIDDFTVSSVLKMGPNLVNSMRIVSKDRKTLTITVVGKDEQGRPLANTSVYNRQ